MIKLTPIVESIPDREFEHDLYDIQSEVEQEWWSGQEHQSWKLVPARDLLFVWNTFAKYGRIDENKLEKIWEIVKTNTIKIILNSDWWNHGIADLFGKDKESEVTADEYERFARFIGDGTSTLWRGTGDSYGMGRYSDAAKHLYKYLMAGYSAQTPEEKLMAIDRLLNFVHGSGAMAKWFVEGGVATLNKVRDFETKGIHLTGKLSEVEFRKQKTLIHVADVPMFSVFVPATVKAIPHKILKNYYEPRIKDVLGKARNEIHRLGFPSMHANVVLTDLSKEPNVNTGEMGISGRAHHYKKYMEIDPKYFYPDIVVHEWAHLWMMNNSKAFKKAVKLLYQKMMKDVGAKIPLTQIDKPLSGEDELVLINAWAKGINDMFGYLMFDRNTDAYILHNKKITPELFPQLPHLLRFEAQLKRPIIVSSLYGSNTILPAGTVVDVIKGNSGWLIGKEINKSRFEMLTKTYEELFDYVESNQSGNLLKDIKTALQKDIQSSKKYNTPKYLSSQLDKQIKSGLRRILEDISRKVHARPTPEEEATVQSWSKFILPQYLRILRDAKLMKYYQENRDKIYDILWVNNKHKPADLSFTKLFTRVINRSRAESYRKVFADKPNLVGKEFGEHRETMANLTKWVNAYGMSNEDELWATAVEYFFKLPDAYKKAIIKIMMHA